MRGRWTGGQNWVTFMILFVLLLILTGFTYPKEVRMIPFVVGFPTLFLLLILWIGGLYPSIQGWIDSALGENQDEKKGGKGGKEAEFTRWKSALIVMSWVILFYFFVFLFGFALISPIFIAFFLVRKAGLKWPTSICSAVIANILIYVFMEGVIKADLWCGAIPEVIPGILGGAIIPPL